jgi:GNAT superfamily N-acetyltransferase
MDLVPLMPDTLVEAQQLAAELFPWEHEHQVALAATVAPLSHPAFFRDRHIASIRVWTYLQAGRVVGLAGLHSYIAQPGETWLAWFGLQAAARGCGKGTALLDWVIAEARAENKHTLRLWTTDESEYAKALALYASRGFRRESWPSLPGETWETYVLTLGLNGQEPLPWALCSSHGDLCGREAPHLVAA